jgi:histidine triad (HIT) family protein
MIPWLLSNMSDLLPVKRLLETDTLVAIHHPRPAYAIHILILPKAAIPSLDQFVPAEHGQFLMELFDAVNRMVRDYHLDKGGYRLIVNGGDFQEIPQLHFHLISDFVTSQD